MMYVIMWRKKTFIFRAYNSWRMRKWWELCMGPEHWTLTRRCLRPAPVTRTRSGPGHWLRAPEQLTGNTRRGWRGGALRGARGHASISPSLHCRVTAPPRSWFVNWYLQHPRTTQLFLNIYTLKVKTSEHLSTGSAPLLFQRQSYATPETSGHWTEIPLCNVRGVAWWLSWGPGFPSRDRCEDDITAGRGCSGVDPRPPHAALQQRTMDDVSSWGGNQPGAGDAPRRAAGAAAGRRHVPRAEGDQILHLWIQQKLHYL